MDHYYFKNPNHFGDMFGNFEEFYRSDALSDVVIAVEGRTINLHRIVLSAGSDYFRRILTNIKQTNHVPVLIINDISFEDMETILEFIYRGQIVVTRDKVESLRQAAYKLRVKGFENFLRKPFLSSANGVPAMGSQHYKLPNGNANRNGMTSMLNQETTNKRAMHMNENAESKRMRMNNKNIAYDANRVNENKQAQMQLHFNRFKEDLRNRIVPNSNGHLTPDMLQQKLQLEQLFKRASLESNRSAQSPKGDMAHMKVKSDPDAVSITPLRHDSHSANDDAAHQSCDEHEDNQRNENTENGLVEEASDLSTKSAINNVKVQNGQADAQSDEEESHEVNYTYEMDPTALTGGWDTYNDENVPENHEGDSEGYEDEENYFENSNLNRDQQAKLEMLFNQANIMKQMNGQVNPQSSFFYCEHCPKYFFDEDHLQLHIKRSHGLNKLNQCNICGKTYAWKSGLYKHKRAVHNITVKKLDQLSDNDVAAENVMSNNSPIIVQ